MWSLSLRMITFCLAIALTGCANYAHTDNDYYGEGETRYYESAGYSQAELQQMLAPIALYPDVLLSQILMASTYPAEVEEAAGWITRRPGLQGQDAVNEAQYMGWDPSVASLVAFPHVLQRMNENGSWTARLGQAYLEQEGDVIDAIQVLRDHAYRSGHLQDLEYADVYHDNRIIIIEPRDYAHVHVPYYSHSVYGNWWWPDYPPYFWRAPVGFHSSINFYWGSGYYVAPTFFYSNIHWHNRRLVIYDRKVYRPYSDLNRHYDRYRGAKRWVHNRSHRREAPDYHRDRGENPRAVYRNQNYYDRDRDRGNVYRRGGGDRLNQDYSPKRIERDDRGRKHADGRDNYNKNQNWQQNRESRRQSSGRESAQVLKNSHRRAGNLEERRRKESKLTASHNKSDYRNGSGSKGNYRNDRERDSGRGRELNNQSRPVQQGQFESNRRNSQIHSQNPNRHESRNRASRNDVPVDRRENHPSRVGRDSWRNNNPSYNLGKPRQEARVQQSSSQSRGWKNNSQQTRPTAGQRQGRGSSGKVPYRSRDRGGS